MTFLKIIKIKKIQKNTQNFQKSKCHESRPQLNNLKWKTVVQIENIKNGIFENSKN